MISSPENHGPYFGRLLQKRYLPRISREIKPFVEQSIDSLSRADSLGSESKKNGFWGNFTSSSIAKSGKRSSLIDSELEQSSNETDLNTRRPDYTESHRHSTHDILDALERRLQEPIKSKRFSFRREKTNKQTESVFDPNCGNLDDPFVEMPIPQKRRTLSDLTDLARRSSTFLDKLPRPKSWHGENASELQSNPNKTARINSFTSSLGNKFRLSKSWTFSDRSSKYIGATATSPNIPDTRTSFYTLPDRLSNGSIDDIELHPKAPLRVINDTPDIERPEQAPRSVKLTKKQRKLEERNLNVQDFLSKAPLLRVKSVQTKNPSASLNDGFDPELSLGPGFKPENQDQRDLQASYIDYRAHLGEVQRAQDEVARKFKNVQLTVTHPESSQRYLTWRDEELPKNEFYLNQIKTQLSHIADIQEKKLAKFYEADRALKLYIHDNEKKPDTPLTVSPVGTPSQSIGTINQSKTYQAELTNEVQAKLERIEMVQDDQIDPLYQSDRAFKLQKHELEVAKEEAKEKARADIETGLSRYFRNARMAVKARTFVQKQKAKLEAASLNDKAFRASEGTIASQTEMLETPNLNSQNVAVVKKSVITPVKSRVDFPKFSVTAKHLDQFLQLSQSEQNKLMQHILKKPMLFEMDKSVAQGLKKILPQVSVFGPQRLAIKASSPSESVSGLTAESTSVETKQSKRKKPAKPLSQMSKKERHEKAEQIKAQFLANGGTEESLKSKLEATKKRAQQYMKRIRAQDQPLSSGSSLETDSLGQPYKGNKRDLPAKQEKSQSFEAKDLPFSPGQETPKQTILNPALKRNFASDDSTSPGFSQKLSPKAPLVTDSSKRPLVGNRVNSVPKTDFEAFLLEADQQAHSNTATAYIPANYISSETSSINSKAPSLTFSTKTADSDNTLASMASSYLGSVSSNLGNISSNFFGRVAGTLNSYTQQPKKPFNFNVDTSYGVTTFSN